MTARAVEDARADLVRVAREGVTWPGVPTGRGDGAPPARRSAVLVLFGVLDALPAHGDVLPVPAELDVLLHRRAATLAHHPGQVAFPGGGIDPEDDGPVGAALREAVEETGLDPSGVDVLGTLADVPVPVSDNLVTPVLAWWSVPSRVVAVDHREAVDVFRVPGGGAGGPPPARGGGGAPPGGRGRVRTPAFTLDGGVVVWGFTALVLAGVLDAAGWSVPWDHSRTVVP